MKMCLIETVYNRLSLYKKDCLLDEFQNISAETLEDEIKTISDIKSIKKFNIVKDAFSSSLKQFRDIDYRGITHNALKHKAISLKRIFSILIDSLNSIKFEKSIILKKIFEFSIQIIDAFGTEVTNTIANVACLDLTKKEIRYLMSSIFDKLIDLKSEIDCFDIVSIHKSCIDSIISHSKEKSEKQPEEPSIKTTNEQKVPMPEEPSIKTTNIV